MPTLLTQTPLAQALLTQTLRRPLLPLAAALLVLLASTLHAQEPTPQPSADASQSPTPAPEAPAGRGSAQETYGLFLRAATRAQDDPAELERAIGCLDLSAIDPDERLLYGRVWTAQLRSLLVSVPHARFGQIPADPSGPPFVLYRDPQGKGTVVLERVGAEWKFAGSSLKHVQELLAAHVDRERAAPAPSAPPPPPERYDRVSDWIRAHVPSNMTGRAFLLEFWQWAALGLLILLGLAIHLIALRILAALTVRLLRATGADPDPDNVRAGLMPCGLLVMAAFWWGMLRVLGLHPEVLQFATVTIQSLAALASVWGMYRLVDVISNALERKALRTESRYDDLLVPLLRKSLKTFVIAFGFVFVADTLQFSIKSLLAGLGLGGLAFALAAQDTVKNFFGSLTVVLDRPFEVGDWVLIDKVEGSVEELGFRSTRIRTFYNSVITLPNSKLLTAVVDNMGRRQYRRWTTKLGVAYHTTPEQLEALCEGIRELIRTHPYTRKDYYMVTVSGLAAASIEVMIYTFFETPDWGRELRERQRLILDVLRLCRALDVDIAFPTQTLHLVDRERASADERAADDAVPARSPEQAQEFGRMAAQRLLQPSARSTARLAAVERLEDLRKAEEDAKARQEDESTRLRGEIDDPGATGGEGEGGGEG